MHHNLFFGHVLCMSCSIREIDLMKTLDIFLRLTMDIFIVLLLFKLSFGSILLRKFKRSHCAKKSRN